MKVKLDELQDLKVLVQNNNLDLRNLYYQSNSHLHAVYILICVTLNFIFVIFKNPDKCQFKFRYSKANGHDQCPVLVSVTLNPWKEFGEGGVISTSRGNCIYQITFCNMVIVAVIAYSLLE